MHKNKTNNKVNQQAVSMLDYYLTQLFPQILKGYQKNLRKSLNLSTQYRDISYRYICDSIQLSGRMTRCNAFLAASQNYHQTISFQIDKYRGVKESQIKLKMMPVQGKIVDQIDILLQSDNESKDENLLGLSRQSFKKTQGSLFTSTTTKESNKIQQSKHRSKTELFQLYIIHHSQQNQQKHSLEWLNYIQKFNFVEQVNQSGVIGYYIIYQAVMTKKNQQVLLPIDFNQLLLKKYFQQNCKLDKKGKALILESFCHSLQLTQTEELKACQLQIQKKSYDPIHRRSLSLPKQHRNMLQLLNNSTLQFFKKLSPQKEPDTFFIQNLVCRMLQNNNFKQKQTKEAIQYYLIKIKELQDKYTWDSFKEQRLMNIFNYIGNDYMGIPVVFNTIRNIRFSKIKDKNRFIDFQLYFYGVYLREKMGGWVDRFNAVFDTDGQSSQNTDFSVTKKVAYEAYKLFYGQSNLVLGYNLGLFARAFTKILFPLLPRQLVQSIVLYGNEREQVLSMLRQNMSDEVIPDFLGGKNHNVYELSISKIQDNSYFDKSFIPFQ